MLEMSESKTRYLNAALGLNVDISSKKYNFTCPVHIDVIHLSVEQFP